VTQFTREPRADRPRRAPRQQRQHVRQAHPGRARAAVNRFLFELLDPTTSSS
jgi:hypothetical protein